MLRGIWVPSWELQGTGAMAWGLWSYDGSFLQGSRKDAAPQPFKENSQLAGLGPELGLSSLPSRMKALYLTHSPLSQWHA